MAKRADLPGYGYAGLGTLMNSCLSTSPEGGVQLALGRRSAAVRVVRRVVKDRRNREV